MPASSPASRILVRWRPKKPRRQSQTSGSEISEPLISEVCDDQNNWHQVQHHWHAPKKDNYVDMEHRLANAGGLQYGIVGNSISRLSNAVRLRECLLPVLQKNPEWVIRRLFDNDFIWE